MVRIKRLLKSFSYAGRGLFKIFSEEQNLRIQVFVALVIVCLALYFQVARLEWTMLIFSITVVILMEVVNSATERVTDVLKPRIDTYVKEIKDIMAAAVMLASIMSVIVGIIIFWPYFLTFLL